MTQAVKGNTGMAVCSGLMLFVLGALVLIGIGWVQTVTHHDR
jgi:hypothetical protein